MPRATSGRLPALLSNRTVQLLAALNPVHYIVLSAALHRCTHHATGAEL
jgi:hypothetical protein